MSTSDEQIKSIFLNAAEISAESAQSAYLDQRCGDNTELRREIEELLRHQKLIGTFLESTPVGAVTLDESVSEQPGTQIGPYKLLQQIGEGGMGVVYVAEQTTPVARRVALKVIKPGMDSRQVISRFEAERQALAMMDHPNVAKVLDAGTTDSGRPYFVMELVKGVPITEYCDQQHLTPRERLELFVPICQAVQHAHQKGIVHRDLKPSNILVAEYDDRPIPKIIDFGVAKAISHKLTEKTMFTQYGQIVGTIEYMSPEQAKLNQLDVDTRSDIYSLGVLLYELLTGETPFDKPRLRSAAFDELLRIIREEEPPRMSTRLSSSQALPSIAANRKTEPAKLSGLVQGELDWIVMKALEKDRSRRYDTANAFARDVQRYLCDESVEACPPSAAYRFRKFARRNKGSLTAAGILAAALLVAVSGVGWAIRDRTAQRAERLTRTMTQLDLILTDVEGLMREQRWQEALISARRADAAVAGGEADAATEMRVGEVVKNLEFVERLGQIREAHSTWITAAKSFDNEGTNRAYAEAFRQFGVDVETQPVGESISQLQAHLPIIIPVAGALDHWVSVVQWDNSTTRGRLLSIARGIDPEPLRDKFRSILDLSSKENHDEDLERLAQTIDVRSERAATISTLAGELKRMNRRDAALRLLRDAQAAHPGDFWLNFNLASLLADQHDHEGAIRFYTAAMAIRPETAATYNNLGIALGNRNQLDEAIASYRKCIALDPGLSYAYVNLGGVLFTQNKFDEAIVAFRKTIEVDPKYPGAHTWLGRALNEQNKPDEAIAALRQAVEYNAKDGAAQFYLIDGFSRLGRLEDVLDIYIKHTKANPQDAQAHRDLAMVLRKLKRFDESVESYDRAIAIDSQNPWPYYERGVARACMGEWEKAGADFDLSLRLDPNVLHAWTWTAAASVRLQLGDIDGYRNACQEVVKRFGQDSDPIVTRLIASTCSLTPDALTDFSQVEQIARQQRDEADGETRCMKGLVYLRSGRFDEAIRELELMLPLEGETQWQAAACAILALAFRQTGNEVEGKVFLARAQDILTRKMPEVFENPPNDWAWNEWLRAQILTREAGKINPEDLADYANRAKFLAVEFARRATQRRPDDYYLWKKLGVTHYRAGNWSDAITALEESCRLESATNGKGNAWQWLFLAMAHWQLGNHEQACKWYVQSLEVEHVWPEELLTYRTEAENLIGVISAQELASLRMEFWSRQLSEAREAVRIMPDDPLTQENLASCLFQFGHWSESADHFRQVKDSIRYEYFLSLLMQSEFSAYETLCRKAAEQLADSTNPDDLMELARSCSIAPQNALSADRLVAVANKGLSQEPDSHWRNFFTGLCLYRVGNDAEAEKLMSKALEKAPGWNAPHAGLAMVYQRLGDSEKARFHWDQAASARQELLEQLSGPPDVIRKIENPLGYAELMVLTNEARAVFEPQSTNKSD